MIVDKIQEYIGDHSAPGVLFVIKGYAFTEFESCATSLGKTIEDKGSRFMEILQQPTKVICYEEFICLREISYTINIQHLLSLVKLLNPRRIHRNVRL